MEPIGNMNIGIRMKMKLKRFLVKYSLKYNYSGY